MGDLIAEVYGYQVARQLIWMAIFCQIFFALTCATMAGLPSTHNWAHQEAYTQFLTRLPRVAVASSLAIIAGAFINAYAISKWKILLRGKYFWLRSLGASMIGELIFTVVSYTTEFFGIISTSNFLHLMAISYVIKLVINPILVFPLTFAVYALKQLEGVDVYDYDTNFTPFRLGTDSTNNVTVLSTKNMTSPRMEQVQ
jgi:queuosine precursor transporter